MGYKIIDDYRETVKDGFGSCAAAYNYLALTYTVDFIHEMHFRVIREEEEDERDSSEL